MFNQHPGGFYDCSRLDVKFHNNKMSEIKKLSKSELEEGLTLELVNQVDMKKRHSPVLFDKDGMPCSIMKCSKGYWRSIGDGKYEKDSKNNFVVYSETDCQTARARYLLHYSEEEKKQDAEKVLAERKKKIEDSLSDIEKKIEHLKSLRDKKESDIISVFESAILANSNEWQRAQYLREREAKEKQTQELIGSLPRLEQIHAELKAEYEKGNYNYLLYTLKIEKIDNPMTFKFDNENDMNAARAFTKTLIESGDVNKAYARLKVESESV